MKVCLIMSLIALSSAFSGCAWLYGEPPTYRDEGVVVLSVQHPYKVGHSVGSSNVCGQTTVENLSNRQKVVHRVCSAEVSSLLEAYLKGRVMLTLRESAGLEEVVAVRRF